MSTEQSKAGRWVFAASIAMSVVMVTVVVVLALVLPVDEAHRAFNEALSTFDAGSPIETASPWLWLALAVWIPLVFRKPTLGVLAGMIIAMVGAAREWDWHIRFTGYSMLKPPFYYRDYPLDQKIIAGAIMLVVIASAVVLVARLIHLRPWKRPIPWWARTLAFAILMLVFSKAVDRAPAIMDEQFGISLSERLRLVFYAVEEGIEMLLPVFFGAHALALARWHATNKGSEPTSKK